MAMGSGLLALAILATEAPQGSSEEATTFQVQVLTLNGLDWRTTAYPQLQRVAHQGTSTIWTADRSLASSLVEKARSVAMHGKIITTTEAVLSKADCVTYISAMDRVANGPINQSSAIAFMPRPDRVEEKFTMKVAGRKLDQGILAWVRLEESHVASMHCVPQTESLKATASKTTRTPTEVGREILNVVMTANAPEPGQSITTSVQVPEISQARVEGEWLIPNNGVLLVSLGVNTVADEKGLAVVQERIAVIEAASTTMPVALSSARAEVGEPMPIAYARLPRPATPSRSMPEPVDVNGNVVDLPPLPEALASTELNRINPAPNQPSPQVPILSVPIRDTELARTSFDAAEPVPTGPASDSRLRLIQRVMQALANAGVEVDIDVDTKDLRPVKPEGEKCEDEDELFCPLDAKPVPEMSGKMGVTFKDSKGSQVFNAIANLENVLKTPGRTETTVIPLGGQVALEIKATIVPRPMPKVQDETKPTGIQSPAKP